jgi:diguanylate cyclase (GGDEF)-like protein
MIRSGEKDEASAQLEAERIEDALRHAVIGVAGGTVNAVAVVLTMLPAGYPMITLGWLGCIVLVAIARLDLYRRRRADGWATIDIRRDPRHIHATTLANGVLWGIGIAASASVANTREFAVIAMLSGGMLGGAVMTFATMPLDAFLFMAPICLGTIVAWALFPGASMWIGALFCASYLVILMRGVIGSERAFAKGFHAREALREAGATVQLLLNDFEAQSADWLWKVDAAGRIHEPGTRFGDAAARPWQLLEGAVLADLFDACPERDRLIAHLERQTPFRDITLPLTLNAAPHWWTLSAQPWSGGMRGVARDVTAQKRAEARVSHMAHYDGLTDLANRFLFNETLTSALRRRPEEDEVAVLCLDLDRFKSVNDTLGHPAGDKLLCDVARRIEAAVRPQDLVARLGGDEFAILLQGRSGARLAETAAKRVIAALARPFVIDDVQVVTSTSIGVALAGGDGDEQAGRDGTGRDGASTLMKQADLALYAAKAQGRGRFAYFAPGMDEAAAARRELEMDLRTALIEGEFELHYQPLVSVATRRTIGYEALIRWRHPERGMIMPDTFIPLAEETGLIVPLGEWVIRHGCEQLARWPEHLHLAVNLSPAQLRGSGLITTVMQAIHHSGIDPSRLELEITENVLLHDDQMHASLLHGLRGLGVRVALDDFGTGYSSVNYLRAFPFDKIKIDRCFLKGLGESNETLPIVRAVIALAHAMGMVTTAEGVENEAQLAVLTAEGCDQAQGYLFSAALPADQFTDLRPPVPTLSRSA